MMYSGQSMGMDDDLGLIKEGALPICSWQMAIQLRTYCRHQRTFLTVMKDGKNHKAPLPRRMQYL